MDRLEPTFQVEKDTKHTRRYQEETGDDLTGVSRHLDTCPQV